MSDNSDIRFSIGWEVDQASANAAKAAVQSVSNSAKNAAAEANKAGAGANALQQELGKLSRADQLRSIGTEMGALAKKTQDTGAAVAQLNAKLKELGATDDEIKGVASSFESARNASDPSGGGNKLSRIGSTIRGLPSIQIPGLGIGTDAIGNFARLGGAIQEASKQAAAARAATAAAAAAQELSAAASGANAAATTTAAAAETAQTGANAGVAVSGVAAAGGTLAFLAAMAPIAIVGAVVAAGLILIVKGLQSLAAASNETNEALTRAYEANRSIQEAIIEGATSEDAAEQVRKATERVKNETDNLKAAKEANDKLFADISAKYGDFFARVAALFGLAGFSANNKEIDTATENLKENTTAQQQWQKAIDENKFAANDAKKAAEEKAKADEDAAQESARASEKAAAEKKKSEDAAARAAEQAAEKIKQAQDAIAKATENYTNKQVDIARQSAEKLADIQRSAADKRSDTTLKFDRDLVNLTEKSNVERLDALQKSARAEYQATVDTNRKLEDLRNDAIESETEATDSRNFLQAAKIRKGLEKANEDALKDAARAAEDRALAVSQEEQDRLTQLDRARQERAQAYRQEQIDNQTNLNRQLRDARIAKDRQLNEAQIAYNREIQAQQAFLAQMGANNAAYYAQQTSMAQAAANGGSTQAGISREASTTGISISGAGQFSGSISGLRPIATNNNRAVTINIAAGATDRELTAATVRALGEVGLT